MAVPVVLYVPRGRMRAGAEALDYAAAHDMALTSITTDWATARRLLSAKLVGRILVMRGADIPHPGVEIIGRDAG